MLHLEAGVHLQEVRLALLVHQELQRAQAGVAGGVGRPQRHLAELLAQPRVYGRGRRLLDHLLMAALDGALALPQGCDVPPHIADDLELDVAHWLQELLQVQRPVPKGRGRLLAGRVQRRRQLLRAVHSAHPPPAAAAGRLDHDGVADAGGGAGRLPVRRDLLAARHHRNARLPHQLAGLHLVPQGANGLRGGPYPCDASVQAGLGEVRVLGQEAVAGMQGVGAGLPDDLDDALAVEVALAGRRRADEVGLIGVAHMEGVAVRLRIDGHGGDTHLAAGPYDAERDLAAVRYEELLEQRTLTMGLFYDKYRDDLCHYLVSHPYRAPQAANGQN